MRIRLFFAFLALPLFAFCSLPKGITTEARFSYFIPSSHTIRDVYHSGGVDYELTGVIPVWEGINIWWAGDYFYRTGSSLGNHNKTKIQIGSITLGAKYLMPIDRFTPYLGLAMRYFFLDIHNHAPYVTHSIWKTGLGGAAEIGSLIEVMKHFILDVYAGYSYKQFSAPHSPSPNVKTSSQNIGGWNIGGGLGYQF